MASGLLGCGLHVFLSLFFLLLISTRANSLSSAVDQVASALDALDLARRGIRQLPTDELNYAAAALKGDGDTAALARRKASMAFTDCIKLYRDSEYRLKRPVAANKSNRDSELDFHGVRMAISAALTSHRTCMDGLFPSGQPPLLQELDKNVTRLLRNALDSCAIAVEESPKDESLKQNHLTAARLGLLESWNPSTGNADVVVAQDGTGDFRTINEAVAALPHRRRGDDRAIIYVKAGVYAENIEIKRQMRDVMFVGDGIDRTIVTEHRSVQEGYSTYSSATFGVSGDGFWARDMTFENTAGPEKHQAVALRVSSDRSVFYRCSIKGYQDTLFVHSTRHFYRDCDLHGTVDFIFGNAAAVLQNCNVFVRRPMWHQANMVTAQGRETPGDPTGIVVHRSRIYPGSDLAPVKGEFRTYLGRPWKKYSRTVIMVTDLDGLVDRRGWAQWRGRFALDTLYYGEYMNVGAGAAIEGRVDWPGFHVLRGSNEAEPFTVGRFIQGDAWLPETGIPFELGL